MFLTGHERLRAGEHHVGCDDHGPVRGHDGPVLPDVEDFASALHRPYADLSPLCGMTFTGEVRAVPEGRVVFAGEPLLEVTAPLAEAQLVETFLLNQVSHQTAVASKAVRSVPGRRGTAGGRLLAAPHARDLRRDAGRAHCGSHGFRGDQ